MDSIDLSVGDGLIFEASGTMAVNHWDIVETVRGELRYKAPRVHGSDHLADLIRDIVADEISKVIADGVSDRIEL